MTLPVTCRSISLYSASVFGRGGSSGGSPKMCSKPISLPKRSGDLRPHSHSAICCSMGWRSRLIVASLIFSATFCSLRVEGPPQGRPRQ